MASVLRLILRLHFLQFQRFVVLGMEVLLWVRVVVVLKRLRPRVFEVIGDVALLVLN